MPNPRYRRRWIKLWTQETLYGTTSRELEPAERAVWFGLLALAGDSPEPGKVEIAPGVAYTRQQLCQVLNIPESLLESALKKMLEHTKVEINSEVIVILNWEQYQGEYRAEYMKEYMQEYRKRKTVNRKHVNRKHVDSKTVEQTRTEGRGGEQNTPFTLVKGGQKQVLPDPKVKEILDIITEKVGYQIASYGKEGAAVKRALKLGFSVEQFMGCWQKLKTFPFWYGKWLPLATVTENIGEFVAGRLKEGRKPRDLPTHYTDSPDYGDD